MPIYELEVEHRETDQVFSYYHGGGDEMLHFNVSLLARLHKQMPAEFRRITMDIGQAEYDLCMGHRGIEEPKVAKLSPKSLREPGYGCLFDEGSFTIVDGHHRLVRRFRGGVRVMDFWVSPRMIWEHCLVEYNEEGKRKVAEAMPPRVENPEMIPSVVKLHKQ